MPKGLIDAAFSTTFSRYQNKGWFFKGGQYYRYDFKDDKADLGFPRATSAWDPVLAGGFDAAINGQAAYDGKLYFFQGSQYYRYDWQSDARDLGAQPLTGWGLSGDFAAGVDAALDGIGVYAGKTYFFKKDQYVRYDWRQDRIDVGPRSITAWGLTGDFATGIDAVVNGQDAYANNAYFFKGDRYVRYDWVHDRIDWGPVPVIRYWQGLGELLRAQQAGYPAIYSEFVAQGRMDDDVADLLNELHNYPPDSWARQMAHFAHHELVAKNLYGIVRAANTDKLKPVVSAAGQGDLAAVKANGGAISANAQNFPVDEGGGVWRSFLLVNNDELDQSGPGSAQRAFLQLVLPHELTHFRNNVLAVAMDTDALLDPARYVDPALAGTFPKTHLTRSHFIQELTCRHVAWHVLKDLQHAAAALQRGQFFNAANAFALAGVSPRGDYADSGYMQALVPRPDDFRRQVGLWLKDVDRMLFHDDPVKNGQAQQLMRDEIAFVQPTYALPLALPDGMA